jgi:hypothetical protein
MRVCCSTPTTKPARYSGPSIVASGKEGGARRKMVCAKCFPGLLPSQTLYRKVAIGLNMVKNSSAVGGCML